MIPRYARPEMTAIWAPATRFRIWFEIEAHACDALAEIGAIPKESARAIWEKAGHVEFDVARIDEIERVTKHDVIAFLTHLAEFIGPEARFVHQGLTSSDVLDTCLAVQLQRASDILIADVDKLLAALKAPRLRAQVDADDWPLARHPRRADDLRAEACGLLRRVRARADAAGRGARGNIDLRDLRRDRDVRQYRSARRGACRGEARVSDRSRSRRR